MFVDCITSNIVFVFDYDTLSNSQELSMLYCVLRRTTEKAASLAKIHTVNTKTVFY